MTCFGYIRLRKVENRDLMPLTVPEIYFFASKKPLMTQVSVYALYHKKRKFVSCNVPCITSHLDTHTYIDTHTNIENFFKIFSSNSFIHSETDKFFLFKTKFTNFLLSCAFIFFNSFAT